jgi:AcrR family transcriptional regulator
MVSGRPLLQAPACETLIWPAAGEGSAGIAYKNYSFFVIYGIFFKSGILGLMQYLSQRLAVKAARARGGGPPRDALAARQRERILDAAEQLIGEQGCSRTSIEAIVKLARVSSVTFYEHFDDKEECFVAAFDRAVEETLAMLRGSNWGEVAWPERLRAGVGALLGAIEDDPPRARLCLVEAQMDGPLLLARYEALLDRAATLLRQGRFLDMAPRGLPDTVEEATAGGIAWLLRERLERSGADGIEALLPKLVEVALDPYLDRAESLPASAGPEGDD